MIFGGAKGPSDEELSTEVFNFTVSHSDMSTGVLTPLPQTLDIEDRFYHNQYFAIEDFDATLKRQLIGIVGRHAFHIFDKTNGKFISH